MSIYKDGIVQNGRERLLKSPEMRAEIARIRGELEQQYADELAQAGWFRRRLLRRKIAWELERRIHRMAPIDGLYLKMRERG